MADSFTRQSKGHGYALPDAAPGLTISSGFQPYAGCYVGSTTMSDARIMSMAPPPPSPTGLAFALTANNNSFSFSFCGSDVLGADDVMGSDPSPTQQQQQQPYAMPLSRNSSGRSSAQPTPPSHRVSGAAPKPVSLSAANLEHFYGIPTPSAPHRALYATSNTSNSSRTTSLATHPSTGSGASASGGGGGGGGDSSSALPDVQKDLLAFRAAEQEQQKFVLQQRNVYMSGLPVDFRPSAFRAMCEVFGHIESSKLCMEADDVNRCRGFGFVLFCDVESANSCIASLNGKVMQGKTLQVRRADLSAAPQPLNQATQRNRSGSCLVTPPALPQIAHQHHRHSGSNNNSIGASNAMLGPAVHSGTPGPATTGGNFVFNPSSPAANANNGVSPSSTLSALPFKFATPTGLASAPNSSSGLIQQKGSAMGSSFMYNGPSPSSSMGNSSTPTVLYPANTAVVSAMRNGLPIMQMYAPYPPPGSASMLPLAQQQQQQPQLVSHPSMSRNELVNSHAATPSSTGSSNMNLGFVTAPPLMPRQLPPTPPHPQHQQQPPLMQFQPQPPMQPPMQAQRPGANVAYYSTVDDQGAAMAPAKSSYPHSSNSGSAMQPSSAYASNVLMQDYLTAATALEPNVSTPNIYYLYPQ
ncbi:hypothetical protein ABB37_02136 [Leptomonas pyrrhocoris]|uniref:RRM domain-containing protein n=1 Tax=Leptomonas pyrrhocoris TaxID=157538 RepID=A0A0N0DYD4_LEPPY|nr:hypothetical protein ABB37_02136 [Leptomonas pyrrhocoris]KPA83992.1 hypothetical protein ABB37_02136 [Leptomonas pyrrhocoris]|eukprot:XP_015662431.1 hypothetical protein ABB37_02136 [Leptomonas pyrrhocoris]